MAFTKKTWLDRIAEYANRRKLIDTSTSNEQIVTVARYEGTITQEGDVFNAATMNDLENRIEDAFDNIDYSGLTNKPTIPAAVAVKGNAESTYRTGNVNITPANVGAAMDNHVHGQITNAGAITSTTTLANRDGIIFADSSDSGKLKRSSITFDGSTTTNFLTQKGTWQAVPYGINASRKICNLSASGTQSWTATEDCFVYVAGTAYGSITVDSVRLAGSTSGNFSPGAIFLPIKKGSTIQAAGSNTNVIWAWGLK